ncbi:T9SS type A sorting domain-containing protein [Psychroserpens sp.]
MTKTKCAKQLDVSNLRTGVYLIKLQSGDSTVTQKTIIK